MRNWRALYEILKFPIGVLLFGVFLLGTGTILTGSTYSSLFVIKSDFIVLSAESALRIGSFLIVNFPFLFLMRLVTKKANSSVTITAAFCGYITFLVVTMYFARTDLVTTAYSSIFGLSATVSSNSLLSSGIHYPLQTGVVATAVVAIITHTFFEQARRRSDYGLTSFMSKDTWAVVLTVVFCGISAVVVCYVWPYVIKVIQVCIDFISFDTTNPVNLAIYGMLDRTLGVLNLGTMIRSPFWYGTNGGSWINFAGTSISGDVSIWTSQLGTATVSGMTGRFITPYYVLNLFAIPGLLAGLYTLQTDRFERRKSLPLYIGIGIMSIMFGTLLPVELLLVLLCPLLFIFHVGFTGILYGVLQAMHVYLGFNYSGTSTLTAMPGTLLEFVEYFSGNTHFMAAIKVMMIGVISFFIYFLFTRYYFKHLTIDLFHTGWKTQMIDETLDALGGVGNIKVMHSSTERLSISLYDPSKLNVNKIKALGAVRITETKVGYAISFCAMSTMVRIGIEQRMKEMIRDITE